MTEQNIDTTKKKRGRKKKETDGSENLETINTQLTISGTETLPIVGSKTLIKVDANIQLHNNVTVYNQRQIPKTIDTRVIDDRRFLLLQPHTRIVLPLNVKGDKDIKLGHELLLTRGISILPFYDAVEDIMKAVIHNTNLVVARIDDNEVIGQYLDADH